MKTASQRSLRLILASGVATAFGFAFAYGAQNERTPDAYDRGVRDAGAYDSAAEGEPAGAYATPRAPHRFGVGANYWRTLDDIDFGDIDRDGFGYFLSYQYKPTLFGLGVDLEMLPDRFGSDAYAPQGYVLFGDVIYAGAGVGIVYTDDGFADDPFYSLRAGLDIPILPQFRLDIYGQYRFESRHDLRDEDSRIDTDTVFLGAAGRFLF